MSLVKGIGVATTGARAPQARAVEKKRAIITAAIEIMFAAGLPKVTHRQVATRAGVPVGSIGYYFHTRDELLVRAVEEIGYRRAELAKTLVDDLRSTGQTTPDELARTLLEVYLPNGRDVLVGWVGLALDCVRESEALRTAIIDYRATVQADLTDCLAAAGRSDIGGDLVLVALDGAIVESAASTPDSAAAHETATRRLLALLDS